HRTSLARAWRRHSCLQRRQSCGRMRSAAGETSRCPARPKVVTWQAGMPARRALSRLAMLERRAVMHVVSTKLPIDEKTLVEFCERWRIEELAMVGSGEPQGPCRPDFLVTFVPPDTWSLLNHVGMEQEFEELIGRHAEIATRRAIEQNYDDRRR